MPSRERARTVGLGIGANVARRLGAEARTIRVGSGVGQQAVAAAAGVSRQWLVDFERDRLGSVDLRRVAVVFACLGHKLAANAYPTGGGLRDAGQIRLLNRFNARLSADWRRFAEAPMPISGDLRAWDELLRGPVTIGVEAETRPSDLQSLERRMAAKQRDSGVDRMVLVVAATDRNRRVVNASIAQLRQTFPLDTRATLAALGAGRDPGANGVVLI